LKFLGLQTFFWLPVCHNVMAQGVRMFGLL
jgi:hypothetical protein